MKEEKYRYSRRVFSDSFKKMVVKDIDNGKRSVQGVCREYTVSATSVYRWMSKYSVHYSRQSRTTIQMKHEKDELQRLRARITELEGAVGRKQMHIDYLEKVLEHGSAEVGFDIKKKSGREYSNGSGPIGGNTHGK